MTNKFTPFANESDSVAISGLTVENRLDRIEIYGSIQLTKDQQGLKRAQAMQALLNAIVVELEKVKDLPDQVATTSTDTVKNPFD